jgi:hypothetical protein
MSKPAAFRAVYSDFKLVKTRGVIQVILEVPVEDSDAAYEVLGGMPVAGKERWFGIAAIKSETEVMQAEPESKSTQPGARPDQEPPRPDRAKRGWRDLQPSQQAGIRCSEPAFAVFLQEERLDDWRGATGGYISREERVADCVRMICNVDSRSHLNTNQKARVIWHQLNDQYEAWVRVSA